MPTACSVRRVGERPVRGVLKDISTVSVFRGCVRCRDPIGRHQPVWNRVRQWLFGAPVISADGRFVAFGSVASDLVANDTNGIPRRVRADLQLGTTTLVSVNRFGTGSGNGSSSCPAISADGRFVAFSSAASDLVANDTNGYRRRVRAGSAAGDDYVGERQPVWNRVRQ